MTTNIDLTSLENALDELVDALKYYCSDLAQQDLNLKHHLRAGTFQTFKRTYELAIKFMRRYLEMTEPSAEIIHAMTFPALVHTAHEKGLLLNKVNMWMQYRDKRNIVNLSYNQLPAETFIVIVPDFIYDAQFLLNQLKNRC